MKIEDDYPYDHEEYMELGKNWPRPKNSLLSFDELVIIGVSTLLVVTMALALFFAKH